MKQLNTILIILLFINQVQGQEMLGIVNSNYAGTTGLSLNPSSMVDSRLGIDVNLFTFGLSIDNDFLFIPQEELKVFGFKHLVDLAEDNERKYFDKFRFDAKEEQFNAGIFATVRGPSAVVHYKDHWVGIQTLMRGAASINSMPGSVGKFLYEKEGLNYQPLHGKQFEDDKFDASGMVWSELAFSYGHPIYNQQSHYFKGAFTFKRLWGYAAAYVKCDGARYSVANDSLFYVTNPDIKYGHAYDDYIKGSPYRELVNGTGWGFDLGVTYEYRPDYQNSQMEMDGQRIEDPTKNHYLLKAGLSFMDLGRIHFNHNSRSYDLSTSDLSYWPGFDTVNTLNTQDFDTTISNYTFGNSDSSFVENAFKIGLPHAVSIQVDYNPVKNVFANLTWINHIRNKNAQIVATSIVGITPRYELEWFEVSVPLSLYQYKRFRVGLGLRLGSFIIGSDKLGSILGLSDFAGMDFYMGLKFSLPRKRVKDLDADGVSDKRDKCPTDRGTWASLGCPDRDGDGVLDKEDACPDVHGLAKFLGCPDKDNDGIPDKDDDCPEVAGLTQFKGCPDTDGDGISDPKDMCPQLAGIPEFEGCPDTDGDLIPDQQDTCPTEKGLSQYHGCPDTDGDGIIDRQDSCPQVVGPASNNGCPIVEKVEVKTEPVKVELTKEESEVISKVFKNLEFETGKSVIRQASYASLDELSVLLKKKTKFKLLIDGHTDNVGKAPYNLKLSKNRAESVKQYLISRGIEPARITSNGYGMTRPVASNKTAEGKQKNRRVEFTIVE